MADMVGQCKEGRIQLGFITKQTCVAVLHSLGFLTSFPRRISFERCSLKIIPSCGFTSQSFSE